MYGTHDLLPALIRFEVVDADEVRERSDHALLIATFNLAMLCRTLGGSAVANR